MRRLLRFVRSAIHLLLPKMVNPFKGMFAREVRRQIAGRLRLLNEKERAIISMRYGIGCDPHTLEEVGRAFSMTKQGAAWRERRILEKVLK